MPKSKENWEGFSEEEERLWRETVKTGEDMDRIFKMQEARRRREAEEELKEQWPSTEAARLFTQLGETFTACQKLLEQNPAIEAAAKLADGERHESTGCCGTIWRRRTGRRGASMRRAMGSSAGLQKCEDRSIAACIWQWRRRVRRSSTCRRWRMQTQSRWRLPKQRKDWWTAHWKKKWPQSWPTFYKWR